MRRSIPRIGGFTFKLGEVPDFKIHGVLSYYYRRRGQPVFTAEFRAKLLWPNISRASIKAPRAVAV
jgi:hypothetical protein